MTKLSGWMWLLCALFVSSAQATSLAPAMNIARVPKIVVVGDSISAGYGIGAEQGWVKLLAQRLLDQGYPHIVINASISGDTTAGGLSRLPALLEKHKPAIVLIELGGNDGLRAQSLPTMQKNLEKMVVLARAKGALSVLFEMRIPSNYGPVYTTKFTEAFGDAARESKAAALVPFFLMPLVTKGGMFQDDGIHPTATAQGLILDAVWPTLLPLLRK